MNRIKSRMGEYPVKKRLAVRTVLALVLVLAFPGGITGCRKKQDNEIEAIRKAGVLQVAIVETGSRFTRKEGETVVGQEPDLAEYIADTLGVKPSYQVCSREEVLQKLDQGEADIALGCINGTNSLAADYQISTPYARGNIYAVTKTGDYVLTTGAFEDSSLGVEKGLDEETRSALYAAEGIRITDFSSVQDAANAVKEESIRAYICHEEQAKVLLADPALQVQNIVNLEPEEFVIAAPKSSQTLVNGINTLIQQFVESAENAESQDS